MIRRTVLLFVALELLVAFSFGAAAPKIPGSASEHKENELDSVKVKLDPMDEVEVETNGSGFGAASQGALKPFGLPAAPAPQTLNPGEKKVLPAADALLIPIVGSVGEQKPDNAHGLANGFVSGNFVNDKFGLGGNGQASGIAGSFLSPAGVIGGGAGSANGVLGLSTVPVQAFAGVSADGSLGFNTGQSPGLIGIQFQNPESAAHGISFRNPEKGIQSQAQEPSVVKDDAPRPVPAAVARPPAPGSGLFALFRPISVPSFFGTSSLLGDLLPGASSAAAVAEVEDDDDEDVLFSLFRPISSSASLIGSGITAFFKPITEMTGQAQGTITLTGGASYTGLKPEPPIIRPPPIKPPCPSEHTECQKMCRAAGKTGGRITTGNCCLCSCPVPERIPGELCCAGTNTACNHFCTHNPYFNYTAGSCHSVRVRVNGLTPVCECDCKISDPCFGEIPIPARPFDLPY